MKDKHSFEIGDWIVCRLSFGFRILRMEIGGDFGSTFLRHATENDFNQIESSVWNDGRKVYEGRFPHKGYATPAEMQASF